MPNTVDDYNIFFSTDQGQRVLANMLLEGGFFKMNKTLEEQAVENFLKGVLAKTGRYPIDGYPDEAGGFMRAVQFVSGMCNRSPLGFVKNIRRLGKVY